MLVLAEYTNNIKLLCDRANAIAPQKYLPLLSYGGCKKIAGLLVNSYKQEVLFEETRYLIMCVSSSVCKMIFPLIHSESKLHSDDSDRQATFATMIKDICECEKLKYTKNTIILGDFNTNPFEPNAINASSLHAIPYKEELIQEARTISGKKYEKFYSPMWRFLGSKEPPYGTYYYNSSKITNYFWNTFDQVIFRPAVIKAFIDDSLEIMHLTPKYKLLKNDYKPDTKFSDHLPLFFAIREELL